MRLLCVLVACVGLRGLRLSLSESKAALIMKLLYDVPVRMLDVSCVQRFNVRKAHTHTQSPLSNSRSGKHRTVLAVLNSPGTREPHAK